MEDVTQILERIDEGDRAAIDELLPKVYETLRHMAQKRMSQERSEHTLQATALVSEAYLRLVDSRTPLRWESQASSSPPQRTDASDPCRTRTPASP